MAIGTKNHKLELDIAIAALVQQQWLHTLNAARFPELPPEGIPIGKGGGMGMVGGAYRGLDEKEEGMAKRLAREEEERLEEEARHGKAQYDEKGQRVGYENPKGVRGASSLARSFVRSSVCRQTHDRLSSESRTVADRG